MVAQQTAEQATGVALSIPVMITAMLMGLDPMGLVLGLISAVLMTFALGGVDNRWKALGGIALAAMMSGYSMPIVVQVILHYKAELKPIVDTAHPLISIIIGGISPTVIPAALSGLAKRAERIAEGK
jgi:hypothetical protein